MDRISDLANSLRPEDAPQGGCVPSDKAIDYIQQVVAPANLKGYTLIDYVNTVPSGRQVAVAGVVFGGRNNHMTKAGDDFDYASYALKTTEEYGGGGKVPNELRWGFMRGNVDKPTFKLSGGHSVVRPVTPLDWFLMGTCDDLKVNPEGLMHKPKGVTKTPKGEDMPLFNFYLSDVSTGGLARNGEEAAHNALRQSLAAKVYQLFGNSATELVIAGIMSGTRWDGNVTGAMEVIVPVWALYARRITQTKVSGGGTGNTKKALAQMAAIMGGALTKAEVAAGMGLAKNCSKEKLLAAFATYDAAKAREQYSTNYTPRRVVTNLNTNPVPTPTPEDLWTNTTPVVDDDLPFVPDNVAPKAPSSTGFTLDDLEAYAAGGNLGNIGTSTVTDTTPAPTNTNPADIFGSVIPSVSENDVGEAFDEGKVGASDIPAAKKRKFSSR